MVAATAIIWAVGVIIATYAGTPPSFVVIVSALILMGWLANQTAQTRIQMVGLEHGASRNVCYFRIGLCQFCWNTQDGGR
jgi:hypothetical protein